MQSFPSLLLLLSSSFFFLLLSPRLLLLAPLVRFGFQAKIRLDVELSAAVAKYSSVGGWVYTATADYPAMVYTSTASGTTACTSPRPQPTRVGQVGVTQAAACMSYGIVGAVQPTTVSSGTVGNPAPNATWAALVVKARSTITVQVAMAVGPTAAGSEAALAAFAGTDTVFQQAWYVRVPNLPHSSFFPFGGPLTTLLSARRRRGKAVSCPPIHANCARM